MNSISFTPSPRKLKRRKRPFLIGGFFVLLILVGVALFSYTDLKTAYSKGLEGQASLEQAKVSLRGQDFDATTKNLTNAHTSFSEAKTALEDSKIINYIPFASRQVNAVRNILEAGIQLTSAATTFTEIGTKAMDIVEQSSTVSFADIPTEQKAEVLKVFYESPPELKGSQAQIQLAKQAIARIPTYGLLPPIHRVATELREQFLTIEEGIAVAIPTIEAVPRIIGYPNEKTYLFLLENNSELRPTGGFIGTYGILKVKYGEITFFETDNIYNLDNPARSRVVVEPPAPLAKYLHSTQWLMRDSNWDPDFPTSAQKALWFYKEESQSQEPIDGVIAVTPTFIQSLLAITGDITVQNVTFTEKNLVDTLQRIVEKDFASYGLTDATRKQIIGDLSKELLNSLLHLPQDQWSKLWDVFQDDIRSKHILVYLEDPELQRLAGEQGWTGAMSQTEHDYLFIVDANLASLKSDPNVFREYAYAVRLESDRAIATLNMTYNNTNELTFFTTRYHTYIRVYVPEGSTLLKTIGAEDDVLLTTEHGKTVFETFKTIEFQDQETLTFEYTLPDRIARELREGGYLLTVQKQPGAAGYGLEIIVDAGKDIQEFSPVSAGASEGERRVRFKTTLDSDKQFMVR